MSHGGGGGIGPLGWLVIIIAGFFVLWYYTGGPERAQFDGQNPFIHSLPPVDSGTTYGPNTHTNQ